METGISNYLFTQGVLGIVCLALGVVVVYQQKKLDKKEERIELIHDARLQDTLKHASDYKEMAKDNQEVLQGNSQSNQLLAAKIEAVKDNRK